MMHISVTNPNAPGDDYSSAAVIHAGEKTKQMANKWIDVSTVI